MDDVNLQNLKILLLNIGGPNDKPLEYGCISAESLKELNCAKGAGSNMDKARKKVENYLTLNKGESNVINLINQLKLLKKKEDTLVKDDGKNILINHITDNADSRFTQSVQHINTDIYKPENLANFIESRRELSVDINNHLKMIFEQIDDIKPGSRYHWEYESANKQPWTVDTDYLTEKEGGKVGPVKDIEVMAKHYFTLGYLISQVNALSKLNCLKRITGAKKEKIVKEIKDSDINKKKIDIINNIVSIEGPAAYDLILLNECHTQICVNNLKQTKYDAYNSNKNVDKFSQILVKKDLKIGGVNVSRSKVKLVPVQGLNSVAESIFIEIDEKLVIGNMHFESYRHKGFKGFISQGVNTNLDQRVFHIQANLNKIKNIFQNKKIILGMDHNSARFQEANLVEDCVLLAPEKINENWSNKSDNVVIKKEGTSTTLNPTVLKARTMFQAQESKINLLDCCSKDIIVGLNLGNIEKQAKIKNIAIDNEYVKLLSNTEMSKALRIDENGIINDDDEEYFISNKIPNYINPFDHFIVSAIINPEDNEDDHIILSGTGQSEQKVSIVKELQGLQKGTVSPLTTAPHGRKSKGALKTFTTEGGAKKSRKLNKSKRNKKSKKGGAKKHSKSKKGKGKKNKKNKTSKK